MVLDCDSYRVNVAQIQTLTAEKSDKERLEMIGSLAVITGVPIIIVTCYLGELYGFSPEIDAKIKRLMSFYTITEVINIKHKGVICAEV